MLDPIFFFRRTERPDRTGTNKVLLESGIIVDGGGHVLRTNTLLLCHGMRKRLSSVMIWLSRPEILDGPKHDFLPRSGTNGHEQPRSFPSGSTRSTRVKTRPQSFCPPRHPGDWQDSVLSATKYPEDWRGSVLSAPQVP